MTDDLVVWLTPTQVAEVLGITTHTLLRWEREGARREERSRIPALPLGSIRAVAGWRVVSELARTALRDAQ